MQRFRAFSLGIAALAIVCSVPLAAQATPRPDDTLGTVGAAIPMPLKWTPPTGPAPQLPGGRPDFNGVWEGRIKLWIPPDAEPLRNPVLGAK